MELPLLSLRLAQKKTNEFMYFCYKIMYSHLNYNLYLHKMRHNTHTSSATIRSSWRTTISKVAIRFKDNKRKYKLRKGKALFNPTFTCDICGHICASSLALRSHKRSHHKRTDMASAATDGLPRRYM